MISAEKVVRVLQLCDKPVDANFIRDFDLGDCKPSSIISEVSRLAKNSETFKKYVEFKDSDIIHKNGKPVREFLASQEFKNSDPIKLVKKMNKEVNDAIKEKRKLKNEIQKRKYVRKNIELPLESIADLNNKKEILEPKLIEDLKEDKPNKSESKKEESSNMVLPSNSINISFSTSKENDKTELNINIGIKIDELSKMFNSNSISK